MHVVDGCFVGDDFDIFNAMNFYLILRKNKKTIKSKSVCFFPLFTNLQSEQKYATRNEPHTNYFLLLLLFTVSLKSHKIQEIVFSNVRLRWYGLLIVHL